MNYYIEIKLLHDPEIGLGFVWKKVFTQIHLALVEQGSRTVGVSFPGYGDKIFPMGDTVRLFAATQGELEVVDISKWMNRLRDYVTITNVKKVPNDIDAYAQFFRVQVKTGKGRLARRYAKRHDVNYAEAMTHYEQMEEKTLTLPFIMLSSLSSSQEMKLFIERNILNEERSGSFNSYGLSREVAVPLF